MPSLEEIVGPNGRIHEWAARINGLLLMRAHGEPVDDAVAAVRREVDADATLQVVLEGASLTGQFTRKLDALAQAIEDAAAYDTLAARADEAKQVLRAGRAAS